ncbi:MAG: FAD:protein FMN transferase [Candidatus Roizmanbacteria bacterium]|nr:FAD:protein FMN transferase [Candidatus Roizmanbacteria bacterium]
MSNTFSFKGIGTIWEIEIYSPINPTQLEYLEELIKKRVELFEQTYSRFRPDSFINSALMQIGAVKLPPDAEKLFTLYKELYTATGGLFTPLIGQVLVEAGYDKEYSLIPKTLHTPPAWEDTADLSYPFINIKKSATYDFGAAGKGLLIDIVSQIIIEQGFPEFCIDAGKDILLYSSKPIRIGLENPLDFKEAIGVVTLSKGSICASAGSRRSWGPYHHIINPKTLTSPNKILATWVIAKEALLADALSTCLFLVPAEKLTPYFSFEYLTLYEDNSIEKSSSFSSELFFK